jgi:hypothetical protein
MSALLTVHFPATALLMWVEESLPLRKIPFRLTSLIPLLLIIVVNMGELLEFLAILRNRQLVSKIRFLIGIRQLILIKLGSTRQGSYVMGETIFNFPVD